MYGSCSYFHCGLILLPPLSGPQASPHDEDPHVAMDGECVMGAWWDMVAVDTTTCSTGDTHHYHAVSYPGTEHRGQSRCHANKNRYTWLPNCS